MTDAPPQQPPRAFSPVDAAVVTLLLVILFALMVSRCGNPESACEVAARRQIESIAVSCQSYNITFGGFPGYFDDALLAPEATASQFTSTENLVLSLMGRIDVGGAEQTETILGVRIDLNHLGQGPIAEVAGERREYGAFYAPKPQELADVLGTTGVENAMPEFLDICSGVPLLYLRDTGSGSRMVAEKADAHFYRNVVADYLDASGLKAYDNTVYDQRGRSLLSGPGSLDNLAWVLSHPLASEVQPGRPGSANDGKGDVPGGGFVLIAPGPDGVYFSRSKLGAQLIDGYEDLERFDDQIHHARDPLQ